MNNDISVSKSEWTTESCDKYDVFIAAFCGAVAGMIDIFFVRTLGNISGVIGRKSRLGKITDEMADSLVKKYAKMVGWNPREGKENNVASAIGFLEKKYRINYDQKNQMEVGGLFKITTRNHHYKSLGHAPDSVGLFFSLLDQFTNTSSFLNDGKLIRIDTKNKEFHLEGRTFVAKLYCGFCNWIGHVMSDLAGSSGNRGKDNSGRGMGVCMPFMEIFQLCNFGEFQIGEDRQSLATLMTRVFEAGYDLRSGAAASVPLILEELMVRVLWSIKKHYYDRRNWSKCISLNDSADLRIMLLIGNGTLCLFDVGDAAIYYGASGGNPIVLVLNLNIPAWVRLILLVFRELRIRFGPCVIVYANRFVQNVLYYETPAEKKKIEKFYRELWSTNDSMEKLLQKIIVEIEEIYREKNSPLYSMIRKDEPIEEQVEYSAKLAEKYKVHKNKIITDEEQLEKYMKKR